MKAICIECANVIEFRKQRGNRLKDHVCSCGASSFRPLIYDHEMSKSLNYEKEIYMLKLPTKTPRFEKIDGKFVQFIPPGRFGASHVLNLR